jgi:Holliday junction resolvasome RuvABC endonuclease subunit
VKIISEYIWAFDLSMEDSGIVIFDLKANPVYIGSIKTNDKFTHGQRLKVIADELLKLRVLYPTHIIAIERGFSRFNMSTQVIYRVHGIVNYLFSDCEQIYYPPKKVKSAIVDGNATKKQVQDKIKKMYPDVQFSKIEKKNKKTKVVTVEENDNESDAFAVGLTYFIENKIIK